MSKAANAPTPLCQADLFASVNSPGDRETLIRAIHAWAPQLPASHRIEVAVNDLVGQTSNLGDAVATEADTLPDLIVSLYADDSERIGEALRVLVKQVAHLLTPSSKVLAARRYEILPGGGAVRLFYALSRLPSMTRDQFQHYWLHQHADVGRRLIPPYNYVQSHSDEALSDGLAAATGLPASEFDGIVTIHFPDLEAGQRQLAREDTTAIALADERKFIDHNHVLLGFFSVAPLKR